MTTLSQVLRPPTAPPPEHGAPRVAMTPAMWPRYAAVLAAVVVLAPLLGRAGVLNGTRALSLGVAAVFAIAGISLNLLMGYAGQISLGHFAFLGVGAFISSQFTAPTPDDPVAYPFFVGILAGTAAAAAVAFAVGLPALRLRGLYLAVITVVFNFAMVQSLFQSAWLTSGSGGVELPRPIVGSFEFLRNADYLAVLLALLVVVWLLDTNLTSSKLGRALHAIRADESMAASFGVDVVRYKLIAFTLSGAIAGLAGASYGHLFTFVSSDTFRFDQSLLLLTLVVLGGLGSRVGVTVIAFVYGILNTAVAEIFSTDASGWILVVSAALLMLTVSLQPEGLAGAWRERRGHGTGGRHDPVDAEATPRLPELPRPTGLPTRSVRSSDPVLSATGVTIRYGGLVAVDDASLEVRPGRIVGLIGPNGAGKTSLFNAISGAIVPQEGRIVFLGRDVSRTPAHQRAAAGMGRTFQLIGLAKDRSVIENLLMAQHDIARYGTLWAIVGLGPAPRIEAELRSRAWDAVTAIGFERYAHTPLRDLSHGQQRIVELACALVTGPELVMLDEPSAGLAPGAVENLADRLRDIRDELGRTVLLIEHNIPLVLDVCDELYVMASGSIIAQGGPDQVVQDETVIASYLGSTS